MRKPDIFVGAVILTLCTALAHQARQNALLRAALDAQPREVIRTVEKRVQGPVRVVKGPVRVVEKLVQDCPPCACPGRRPLGWAPQRVLERTVERASQETEKGPVAVETDTARRTEPAAPPARTRLLAVGYSSDRRLDLNGGMTVWGGLDLQAGAGRDLERGAWYLRAQVGRRF